MRDFFLKDPGWKLLSLFLAIGIWLTVHNILTEAPVPILANGTNATATSAETIIYSNQTVQVVSSLMDVHLYRTVPTEVAVTFAGPADLMDNLKASQIHAIVDLAETNVARNPRLAVEILPPPGVTLIRVEPSRVAVFPPAKP